MQRYWRPTYLIQLAAALLMLMALSLPWHIQDGSGVQVMNRALKTLVAFGLHPFEPNYLPISQWWIVWIIPMVGAVLGLRAANGFIFKQLKGQQKLVLTLGFAMCVGYGWYYAAFTDQLRIGFWLEGLSGAILLGALLLELALPEKSLEESRREQLPPDHPDRIVEGMYRVCMNCGEFNDAAARQCRNCGITLYPQ